MGVWMNAILASLLLGWFVVLVLFLDFVALQLISVMLLFLLAGVLVMISDYGVVCLESRLVEGNSKGIL